MGEMTIGVSDADLVRRLTETAARTGRTRRRLP